MMITTKEPLACRSAFRKNSPISSDHCKSKGISMHDASLIRKKMMYALIDHAYWHPLGCQSLIDQPRCIKMMCCLFADILASTDVSRFKTNVSDTYLFFGMPQPSV